MPSHVQLWSCTCPSLNCDLYGPCSSLCMGRAWNGLSCYMKCLMSMMIKTIKSGKNKILRINQTKLKIIIGINNIAVNIPSQSTIVVFVLGFA